MFIFRLRSQQSSYQIGVAKLGHFAKFILFTWLVSAPAWAKPDHADLPNFQVVNNYLLRGGEPSDHGLKMLRSLGVDVIIDLRAPTAAARLEKSQAESLGMKYINLPMSSKAPTNRQVETFLGAVDKQTRLARQDVRLGNAQKYPHSVFVHCAHGSDRTGCMVGIWRVSRDHWSYSQAYKEMRKYYFGAQYTELAKAVKDRSER